MANYTRKHYEQFAEIFGNAYADANVYEWEIIYDKVYSPIVKLFEADNPRFDMTKFAYVVARGDLSKRIAASLDSCSVSSRSRIT